MKARNLFCAITGKDNCSGSASKTIRLCFLGTSAHSRITSSLSEGFNRGVYLVPVTFSIKFSDAKAVHNPQK